MIDQIAHAIAEADGAALQPLARPHRGDFDAAHKAASFDDIWAINSRRDFKRAVKAMLTASAIKQNSPNR